MARILIISSPPPTFDLLQIGSDLLAFSSYNMHLNIHYAYMACKNAAFTIILKFAIIFSFLFKWI